MVLGFNTTSEVFYEEEFRRWAVKSPSLRSMSLWASKVLSPRLLPKKELDRLASMPAGAADAPRALAQRDGAGRPIVVRGAHGVRIRQPAWAVRKTKYGATNASARGACSGGKERSYVDTSVELCGLRLDNPVVPASGTFSGYGNEFVNFTTSTSSGRSRSKI